MNASEVIQSLARAPFDTPVLIRLPQGGQMRFNIDRIELSTQGQDRWEITVDPDLSQAESS